MSGKYILSVLSLLCTAVCFTGCGNNIHNNSFTTSGEDNINVVCTVFPEYDWTKNITGDNNNINVTYLLDRGGDIHTFQPSAEDIVKISSCDLLVCTGGESEYWIDDVLRNSVNKNMKIINLVDILGNSAKQEEIKEGMQTDEDCGEDVEYDEHTWLSLKNAQLFCTEIAETLSDIDPENSEEYKNNLMEYNQKLAGLDAEFQSLFESSDMKTLVFADRFPFRYFTEDYGLDYYAAFSGCSADNNASFETVTFLSGKIDELGCNAVFELENSDSSISSAVVDNCNNKNCKIIKLNSIQSVTKNDLENGVDYLSAMNENYTLLKEYLS